MNKILGIFGLLVFVCLFTTVLTSSFDNALNLYNVSRWSALFGILSIGVAFVIITGGIDLSIGSVVCLAGCLLSVFIMKYQWPVAISIAAVMLISLGLGLLHGILITKLKLQPFIVTLCGLLVYRGFARWFVADQPQGFGQVHDDGIRQLALGKPCNLATLLMFVGMGLFVVFLLRTIWQWSQAHSGRVQNIILTCFGAILTVVGSASFWSSGDQTRVLNIAGYGMVLSPDSLMFHIGLLAFIPSSLAFIGIGLRDRPGKTIAPTVAVVISSILFMIVASNESLAPMFDKIKPGETEVRGFAFLNLSGNSIRNVIMLCVFIVTGLLMGSFGWLASSVASATKASHPFLIAVVLSGILWLMGMTNLPETMMPTPLLILIVCAVVASVFLNQTIYGRYLLALGNNEEAARYSGINTDRMIILAYVICAGMAGLGAVLFAFDINNMQPAGHGNWYELYAIASAVLGGCSLRGGEGSILGVIIGAAVMRVLYNAINTLGIDTKLELVVIGVVILYGVIADEVVKRIVAARRARMQALAE